MATNHQVLLDRIPHVQDLQSAWLLLVFFASPRPNYILRMLHPVATREFARQHDLSAKRCLEQILHTTIPEETWTLASMPLVMGGLGLRSAQRGRQVSYWASWADVLDMVWLRHPAVAENMLTGLTSGDPGRHLEGALDARDRLQDLGFRVLDWGALADGMRPEGFPDDQDFGPSCLGWQREATREANTFFLNTAVWPRLSNASRAFVRSRGGPVAGLPFSCCPTSSHTRLECSECSFCVACGSPFLPRSVPVGVAVFSTVLATTVQRALLLECWVAEGSRWTLQPPGCVEAGARVTENVPVRDLDILPDAADERRLEVIANGLPLRQCGWCRDVGRPTPQATSSSRVGRGGWQGTARGLGLRGWWEVV